MRELNVNEIKEVNGGNPVVRKVVKEVIKVVIKTDWGDSSNNPDTTLAP